jgi:hypothetical protein
LRPAGAAGSALMSTVFVLVTGYWPIASRSVDD